MREEGSLRWTRVASCPVMRVALDALLDLLRSAQRFIPPILSASGVRTNPLDLPMRPPPSPRPLPSDSKQYSCEGNTIHTRPCLRICGGEHRVLLHARNARAKWDQRLAALVRDPSSFEPHGRFIEIPAALLNVAQVLLKSADFALAAMDASNASGLPSRLKVSITWDVLGWPGAQLWKDWRCSSVIPAARLTTMAANAFGSFSTNAASKSAPRTM